MSIPTNNRIATKIIVDIHAVSVAVDCVWVIVVYVSTLVWVTVAVWVTVVDCVMVVFKH
jgi:hypothetical protein